MQNELGKRVEALKGDVSAFLFERSREYGIPPQVRSSLNMAVLNSIDTFQRGMSAERDISGDRVIGGKVVRVAPEPPEMPIKKGLCI